MLTEIADLGFDDVVAEVAQLEYRPEHAGIWPPDLRATVLLSAVGALYLLLCSRSSRWGGTVGWQNLSVLVVFEQSLSGAPLVNAPHGIACNNVGDLLFSERDPLQLPCRGDGRLRRVSTSAEYGSVRNYRKTLDDIGIVDTIEFSDQRWKHRKTSRQEPSEGFGCVVPHPTVR